jgi:hypothetical protein
MTNPYESPTTVSDGKKRATPVYLRVLAVILWVIAVAPTVMVAVAMSIRPPEADLSDPLVWLDFGFGMTTTCFIPLVGFGCWAWVLGGDPGVELLLAWWF